MQATLLTCKESYSTYCITCTHCIRFISINFGFVATLKEKKRKEEQEEREKQQRANRKKEKEEEKDKQRKENREVSTVSRYTTQSDKMK